MKILYCKVGYADDYQGPKMDDNGNFIDTLSGGGSYNKDKIGHEIFNFVDYDGVFYGFVETGHNKSKAKKIHIERLGANETDDTVDNVLVVFVAPLANVGQVIIGWYNKATVYRDRQKIEPNLLKYRQFKEFNQYSIKSFDAVLLKPEYRTKDVSAIFGQSCISYGKADIDQDVADYVATIPMSHIQMCRIG